MHTSYDYHTETVPDDFNGYWALRFLCRAKDPSGQTVDVARHCAFFVSYEVRTVMFLWA